MKASLPFGTPARAASPTVCVLSARDPSCISAPPRLTDRVAGGETGVSGPIGRRKRAVLPSAALSRRPAYPSTPGFSACRPRRGRKLPVSQLPIAHSGPCSRARHPCNLFAQALANHRFWLARPRSGRAIWLSERPKTEASSGGVGAAGSWEGWRPGRSVFRGATGRRPLRQSRTAHPTDSFLVRSPREIHRSALRAGSGLQGYSVEGRSPVGVCAGPTRASMRL